MSSTKPDVLSWDLFRRKNQAIGQSNAGTGPCQARTGRKVMVHLYNLRAHPYAVDRDFGWI